MSLKKVIRTDKYYLDVPREISYVGYHLHRGVYERVQYIDGFCWIGPHGEVDEQVNIDKLENYLNE